MESEVTVVGAGIGGLTLGVALRRHGWNVEYYEQASEFHIVGSGITLMNNGMQVLDRLGIGEQIRTIGESHKQWTIMDEREVESFTIMPGEYGIGGAHRSELQQLLLDNLPDIDIEFGKRCVDIAADPDETTIRFADGTEVTTTNPVVGADGTHSVIRDSLFPDAGLRSTGHVVHRGLPDVGPPDRYQDRMWQMSFGSYECGSTPYGRDEGSGYWYFGQGGRLIPSGIDNLPPAARPDDLLVETQAEPYDPGVVKRDILGKLDPGPDWVAEMIASTPEDRIVSSEPLEVPRMDTWSRNCVVILGDAAHSMTPFLSVGGSVAMEDALVLSHCLEEHDALADAYAEYDDLRLERAYDIMALSRELGRELTDPDNNALATYRDRPNADLEERYTVALPDHPAYA